MYNYLRPSDRLFWLQCGDDEFQLKIEMIHNIYNYQIKKNRLYVRHPAIDNNRNIITNICSDLVTICIKEYRTEKGYGYIPYIPGV